MPVPDADAPIPAEGLDDAGSAKTIRGGVAGARAVGRGGLRRVLAAEEGFEVVAEASALGGARRYVRGHHPDVLVLDLNLPEGLSLDPIPEIRADCPHTQLVVLTMY